MNSSNNFLIFSHEQDVDGLFSAAVLRMRYPESQVILTNYGFENMLAMKEKILSFTQTFDSGTIIISDISVNYESYLPIYEAFSASKQRGYSNIWIDHHIWPDSLVEILSSVCEFVLWTQDKMGADEPKKCATELCIERFTPASPFAKTLGFVAHRTDFPDSVRFPLPPLTGLISFYLGDKELNHKLYSVILENASRGILWNTEMQEDMIQASRLIDESILRSINSVVVREYDFNPLSTNGHATEKTRVAIVKADSFVSRSHLLVKVIDGMEIDLAIAYTSDGKVSLRRRQEIIQKGIQIDCSKLAAAFREAGGHLGAAGGFLRTDVEQSGDEAVIAEIERTVQGYLEELGSQRTLFSHK